MIKNSFISRHLKIKSVIVAVIIASVLAGYSYASGTRGVNVKSSLYTQALIGKSLLKEKNQGRAMTRQEFAEVLVRIYIKEKRTSIDMLEKARGIKDSKDPYVLSAVKLGFLGSSKGVFAPNKPVSREAAAYAIMGLVKKSNEFKSAYALYGPKSKTQMKISDIKSAAKYSADSVRLMVNSGLIPTLSGYNFKPAASLSVSDAVYATGRLAGILKLRGEYGESIAAESSKKYEVMILSGYEIPKRQFTDLNFYSRTGNDLIIEFSGMFSADKKLSAKALHSQIAAIVKSGGNFSDDDIGALVEHIDGKWGDTSRAYSFAGDVYIKGGRVLSAQPQLPYIKVQKGTNLFIEIPVKGNAK